MTDSDHGDADAARVPPLSIVLGYGPAAMLPLLALVAWTIPGWAPPALLAAKLWGVAILLFLAGVRRGLSFFTPRGPRPAQVVTSIWLFVVGLAALVLGPPACFGTLIVGYASVAILDPPAARRGEAPAHFARLRPPQMLVALAGLAALLPVGIATA